MPPGEGSSQSDSTATVPPPAEGTEVAAEAVSLARAAHTRAIRLRRKNKAAPAGQPDRNRPPMHRRLPRWRGLLAGVGVTLICASSAASGSMWWQQRVAAGNRQLAAEFSTVARQDAVMLLTVDSTKTKEDIQRVLDNSTGIFKSKFEITAAMTAEHLDQPKLVTTVDVKDAAVESMTDNAGVVLVAVQTETTEGDGQRQPASWRLALGLTRDGGQLKISDVQFVP